METAAILNQQKTIDMKLKFLLPALLASAIAMSSCEKDDVVTPSNGNPGTNNPVPTAKRLKKLTRTEAGVSDVFTLTYDNNNRLTSYRNTANTEYALFSYDAQGNLTGVEQQEEEFKNVYAYAYNNNIPVSGTLKTWELANGQPVDLIEDDRLTYTVTNGKVTSIFLEMLQTGTETNLNMTYTGNNLTRVESDGQFPYVAQFTFGVKRSAFPKVSNYVLDQAGFSLQFASNNDMLSASFDFPGTDFDQSTSIQYTYDSEGYILTSDDGEEHVVFEYQ